MFRDRTNLFLSYRRTFPRTYERTKSSEPDSFFDIEENGADESHPMIDMGESSQSPSSVFTSLTQDIDRSLAEAESQMLQLTKLYRKNSLPGFEDKATDEQEIEDLSMRIIQLFQRCYSIMKSLKASSSSQTFQGKNLNRGNIIVLNNLEKNYANKIQASSNKFRVLQNNYLKFLNKDDFKPLPSSNTDDSALLVLEEEEAYGASQQEIDSYSKQTLQRQSHRQMDGRNAQFLREREEEITQLARGVLEVSTIFREMQNLVIDQGTIIDRIDYNLENTVTELKGAHRELEKATVYQKRTQKCKIILLLSLIVITLFFFVMLKPHSHGSKKNNAVNEPSTEGPASNPADADSGQPSNAHEEGTA
ncbi:LAME_0E11188g1_1 [Lachancea meyersii CBS 8951]|uniref:LAME_0E11188g1_1 n=1 Tax=Lachancea meyersii CBS 8951 TaxID=1266667 RepID=A0A1G4JKI2_9SACH|nr:LAME_0E11188g1_1 [Lachancea meyersii CBS 8951]